MPTPRKLLSLSLVSVTLAATAAVPTEASPRHRRPRAPAAASTAAPATPATTPAAAPATPLLDARGRPACGNVMSKGRAPADRRHELAASLAALAALVETPDAAHLAERDAYIAQIREGLIQVEACDTPAR